MVGTMHRVRLDKFTRETWRKFDAKDLEPLKWAIIRQRRVLAMQLRPETRLQPPLDQSVIVPKKEHGQRSISLRVSRHPSMHSRSITRGEHRNPR